MPLSAPLILDLDGTLLLGDMLLESLALVVRRNPLSVILCIWWLVSGGRPLLKAKLADIAYPDIAFVPVNAAVASLAEREHAAGRPVVLATAANELIARRFAQRFPFISRVFASDATRNLKGGRKRDVLMESFPGGFIYAGDSTADLPVWKRSAAAVTVGAPASLVAAVTRAGVPVHQLAGPQHGWKTFARAVRLQQAVKNVLIFAPLLLAGRYGDAGAWYLAFFAFLGFSLVAAGTYLVNDILDLAHDRRHRTKSLRPLASGTLPLRTAFLAIPVLSFIGGMAAFEAGGAVLALVALYAAATLAYSFWLKRIPILDTLIIAGLFSLRLLTGVVAIGAVLSPWLFVFSTALFLSIALAKRHTEVVKLKGSGERALLGRGYGAVDEPLVLGLGTGAALASITFLSLYLMSDMAHASLYASPAFLWIAPVAVFLWLGRVWLLSQRGQLNDDPVAFAVRDRPSLALGGTVAAAFILASTVSLPLQWSVT
ncbi:UbiA family prenyltransferase [Aestuariivirga sp.]|uniref:UbiA family prenyltransferase n=1 Tax=Aestuariivirga sp. TaxID=2650926 RepID=UPI00391CA8BF